MSNTHNAVCHAWAHQTGKARKGFNMFYEGPVIYSYGHHFPIARIVDSPNAGQVVLFTSKGYSISTSKHKTFARRAVNHLPVFYTDDVMGESHEANWAAYIEGAKGSIDSAKRARVYGPHHLKMAEQSLADADEYRLAFGLDKPCITLESLDPTVAEMRRKAAEMERATREAHAKRGRELQRERRKEAKPNVLAWLRGEGMGSYRMWDLMTSRPLVRVKGAMVETSWGASVPLAQALKAFKLATVVRIRGQEWHAKGCSGLKVGDFALTRIGPTGNIVIGCHDIPYRFAKLAADLAGISIAA